MSTPVSPVVFEIWSAGTAQDVRHAGGPPTARPDGRRPPSPVAVVLAAVVGAALASGGFLGGAVVAELHDTDDARLVRQQVDAALADMMRAQGPAPVRVPSAAAPVPADDRGPCAPVRVERLGHC